MAGRLPQRFRHLSDSVDRLMSIFRSTIPKGRDGDRANAVFAAAGYNFSLLLRWLRTLLRTLILALSPPLPAGPFL